MYTLVKYFYIISHQDMEGENDSLQAEEPVEAVNNTQHNRSEKLHTGF